MRGAYTLPSAISAPTASRRNSPASRSNRPPESVRPQGPTPQGGQYSTPNHTRPPGHQRERGLHRLAGVTENGSRRDGQAAAAGTTSSACRRVDWDGRCVEACPVYRGGAGVEAHGVMAAVGASSCGLRSQGPQRRRCPAPIETRKHTLGTPLRRMSRAAWRSGPGGAGQIQIDAPALRRVSARRLPCLRRCWMPGPTGRQNRGRQDSVETHQERLRPQRHGCALAAQRCALRIGAGRSGRCWDHSFASPEVRSDT